MNFLHGRVARNGAVWFEMESGRRLPLSPDTAARDGQEVVYGIRPEHLRASDDGTEAEVVVVEPTGAEVQVFARIDGQNINAVFRERLMLKPGEPVRLAPETKHIHLFDAESGARV